MSTRRIRENFLRTSEREKPLKFFLKHRSHKIKTNETNNKTNRFNYIKCKIFYMARNHHKQQTEKIICNTYIQRTNFLNIKRHL